MKSTSSPFNRLIKVTRFAARIISIMLILVFLIFYIAESLDQNKGGPPTPILNIVVGVLMLGGLVVAFKWEFTGGLASLIGFIGIGFVNPDALTKPLFYLFALPAVLFVLCGFWSMKKKKVENS